LTLFVF